MALSYNGWVASSNPDRIGVVPFEPFPGYDFPGGVKGGDVHTVFTYLAQELDKIDPIEHYPAGDEWGYHYKYSANSPDLLSCHSSATAIDWNATKHPNGVRGTWTSSQVTQVRKVLAFLDCVRWLYDAVRVPDEMHFEISGSPADVHEAALRIKSLGTPSPIQPPLKPKEEDEVHGFIKQKGKAAIWLLESTRYTHVKDMVELNEMAKAFGISTDVADLDEDQFALLIYGRVKFGGP